MKQFRDKKNKLKIIIFCTIFILFGNIFFTSINAKIVNKNEIQPDSENVVISEVKAKELDLVIICPKEFNTL